MDEDVALGENGFEFVERLEDRLALGAKWGACLQRSAQSGDALSEQMGRPDICVRLVTGHRFKRGGNGLIDPGEDFDAVPAPSIDIIDCHAVRVVGQGQG
jgi:hypothetical protein